ncbi:MAG: hypothetical protein O7C75_18200, partial [Verrucomicrobia bacterium]|nr:hypothetical protein [Verrucomicrobiota bacterium]
MSKKNKKRQCPALDTVIDSADCGANRHSKYPCPASCQFSPYNPDNYGQLLEIEEKVDNILFKRGIDHPYFENQLAEALHRNGKEEFKLTGNFVNTLHREVDEAGETLFESWEKARYKGLKNDEIVLLGYKNSMRISVIEIQRIIDHQTVIVQDLLDETSQPRKMVDRSLSARACRFQTLLAYIYSTPDFDRIHGAAYLIPDIPGITAVET